MIFQLQIGQAMHTPDDRELYPVYLRTESDTQTTYITPNQLKGLKDGLENTFRRLGNSLR